MTVLLWPFTILAACGFIASAAVHLIATFGMGLPIGGGVWGLHMGIFAVWIPTVFVARSIQAETQSKYFWTVMTTGCPTWMGRALNLLFVYAFASFFVFIAGGSIWPLPVTEDSWELRGFSGHWMLFYGAAFVTLYSAVRRSSLREERKCPSGHPVAYNDRFCPQCGRDLREETSVARR